MNPISWLGYKWEMSYGTEPSGSIPISQPRPGLISLTASLVTNCFKLVAKKVVPISSAVLRYAASSIIAIAMFYHWPTLSCAIAAIPVTRWICGKWSPSAKLAGGFFIATGLEILYIIVPYGVIALGAVAVGNDISLCVDNISRRYEQLKAKWEANNALQPSLA